MGCCASNEGDGDPRGAHALTAQERINRAIAVRRSKEGESGLSSASSGFLANRADGAASEDINDAYGIGPATDSSAGGGNVLSVRSLLDEASSFRSLSQRGSLVRDELSSGGGRRWHTTALRGTTSASVSPRPTQRVTAANIAAGMGTASSLFNCTDPDGATSFTPRNARTIQRCVEWLQSIDAVQGASATTRELNRSASSDGHGSAGGGNPCSLYQPDGADSDNGAGAVTPREQQFNVTCVSDDEEDEEALDLYVAGGAADRLPAYEAVEFFQPVPG